MSAGPKVGYKRPPAEHRFKPGQSGNPSGRPRNKGGLHDDVLAVFSRSLPVKAGGADRQMSAVRIMMRQLCSSALKGDRRALTRVVRMMIELHKADRHQAGMSTRNRLDVEKKVNRLLGRPENRRVPFADD